MVRFFSFLLKKSLFKSKLTYLLITTTLFILVFPLDLIPKKGQYLIHASIGKINPNLEKNTKLALEYGGTIGKHIYNYLTANLKSDEAIDLRIKFKDISKLVSQRDEARNLKILMKSNKDEIKASLIYKGKDYPAKIRLKGDWVEHLDGEKWSFRVKIRKGESFLGMREFSLQHPKTRNFILEYIYHLLLKDETVPSLRYDFITFRLNGKNLGTYSLEEHFDKLLIEDNKLREGPIIKLSEDRMWLDFARETKIFGHHINLKMVQDKGPYNSEISTFNPKRSLKEGYQENQYLLAKSILNEFLAGKRSVAETFELKPTAKYFAINDLLAITHATAWHNMRFYFNPITARLSPIGFDAYPLTRPSRKENRDLSADRNVLGLFEDKLFLEEYISQLEKVSEKSYLDNFFYKNSTSIEKALNKLQRNYPFVRIIPEEFYKNQAYIRFRLKPSKPISVNYYSIDNTEKNIFSLANKQIFPIKIHSIRINGTEYNPISKVILDGNKFSRIKYKDYEFISKSKIKDNNSNYNYSNADIHYSINGTNSLLRSDVTIRKKLKFKLSQSSQYINRRENSYSYDFIKHDYDNKVARIRKGDWTLNEPLIFPRNFDVNIDPGVNINIKNNAFILFQGTIKLNGNQNNPINIYSETNGRGIIVINAKKTSQINHVNFTGLTNLDSPDLSLMGAVNFYRSDVEINNCTFSSIDAEDALNIFNSRFNISSSIFRNLSSDALDLDFSNGSILNSSFEEIGNDAIDLSGSNVEVSRVIINRVGDKGISVGERSKMNVENVTINSARVAIASKDLSIFKGYNLKFEDNKLCLTSFKKKNEYGPASIFIDSPIKIGKCLKTYLLEPSSTILVGSDSYQPNVSEVKSILYAD